jgi:hypothetical protein
MFDGFTADSNLSDSGFDNFPHLFLTIEDGPGLLILVDVDLQFVDELLVDLLVLVDKHQHLIDFAVDGLVGVEADKVLLTQLLLLGHDVVELELLCADVGL